MRRLMGTRRIPYAAPNTTLASRMIDVASVSGGVAAPSRSAGGALLGVVAAGFSFAGERSADLKKLVTFFFIVCYPFYCLLPFTLLP